MGVSKLSPMKVPLSACVLVLLVAAVQAAKCPDVSVVAPFNVTKYLGTWYEIAGSPLVKDTFERHCFCTHATYEVNPNSHAQRAQRMPQGLHEWHHLLHPGIRDSWIGGRYGQAQGQISPVARGWQLLGRVCG